MELKIRREVQEFRITGLSMPISESYVAFLYGCSTDARLGRYSAAVPTAGAGGGEAVGGAWPDCPNTISAEAQVATPARVRRYAGLSEPEAILLEYEVAKSMRAAQASEYHALTAGRRACAIKIR